MAEKIRAMMIGAHPDDCDLLCGGLTLLYVQAKHTVKYLSLCNGNGGHQSMQKDLLARRRYLETQEMARLAGISYEVWDQSDCELMADLTLRKRLVREIRKFSPDVIFCHRPNDYHADHRNASLLVQDASYLLIVPNICDDVPAMKKMPVIMHFYDSFQNPPFIPAVIIDIDSVIDRKFDLLNCHVSQFYEWLPYTKGTLEEVPADTEARLNWLHGDRIPRDGKLLSAERLRSMRKNSACEAREAIQAALFRQLLVKRYGAQGERTLFAESFAVCEYGSILTPATEVQLFPL